MLGLWEWKGEHECSRKRQCGRASSRLALMVVGKLKGEHKRLEKNWGISLLQEWDKIVSSSLFWFWWFDLETLGEICAHFLRVLLSLLISVSQLNRSNSLSLHSLKLEFKIVIIFPLWHTKFQNILQGIYVGVILSYLKDRVTTKWKEHTVHCSNTEGEEAFVCFKFKLLAWGCGLPA